MIIDHGPTPEQRIHSGSSNGLSAEENGYLQAEIPVEIPPDLAPFWKPLTGKNIGYKAFICPCCKQIYALDWGGMPESFRTHISEWLDGKGCFLSSRPKSHNGGGNDK